MRHPDAFLSSAVSDLLRSLSEHLRFLEEIGIDGVTRDPAWAVRASQGAAVQRGAGPPPDAGSVGAVPQGAGLQVATPPAGEVTRPTAVDPSEALAQIRTDLGDCTRCKLHTLGRRQIVFGVGNPRARLMFVGEAPGADEDLQGIPFVGRAGQLLTKIIEAIGLTRDEVYIANVIKCRPPGNRNPEPDEVTTCEPFLSRQIDVIKPEVIVALGTFAAQALLRSKDPISRLRGQVFTYRGAALIPTFHPAFLLRSPERKRDVWEDMKKVRAILSSRQAGG